LYVRTLSTPHASLDCKQAFPTLTALQNKLNQDIYIVVHSFPLPFHRNAFPLAQATAFVDAQNSSKTWQWIQYVFDQQDLLTNAATADKSPQQLVKTWSSWAANLGIDEESFILGMEPGNEFDRATRSSWRFSETRTS
jgi:hypothetical protein